MKRPRLPIIHFVSILLIALFLTSLSACKKEEGPLEKAGKKVDQLIDDTGKKLDE